MGLAVISGPDTYFEFAEDGGDWEVQFFYAGPFLGDYDLTDLTETLFEEELVSPVLATLTVVGLLETGMSDLDRVLLLRRRRLLPQPVRRRARYIRPA